MKSPADIAGVLVVAITPLTPDETVDEASFRRLLRHIAAGGTDGVVVLGTASEFASLGEAQKQRVMEIAVDELGTQMLLVAGTGDSGTRRAIGQTRLAQRLGFDAALVVPPYYAPLTADEVVQYYRAVADEGGLPIILYNIPSCTKVTLTPEDVAALSRESNIIALKDSSGSLASLKEYLQCADMANFRVVTGSDHLFYESLLAGASGCISPRANVVPGWFVDLYTAFSSSEWKEALGIQRRIESLRRGLARGGYISCIKGALSLMGICEPWVASPSRPIGDAELALIKMALQDYGLI